MRQSHTDDAPRQPADAQSDPEFDYRADLLFKYKSSYVVAQSGSLLVDAGTNADCDADGVVDKRVHSMTGMDEPIPAERQQLFDSLHCRVTQTIASQQKMLLDYLEGWGCQQQSLVAQVLAESCSRRSVKGSDDGSQPSTDSAQECMQQFQFLDLCGADCDQELESVHGVWIDPKGTFNEGQQLRILPVKDCAIPMQKPNYISEENFQTPVDGEYMACVSDQIGLAMTPANREECPYVFELMWGGNDTLLVRNMASKSVCRLYRDTNNERHSTATWDPLNPNQRADSSRRAHKRSWAGMDSGLIQQGGELLKLFENSSEQLVAFRAKFTDAHHAAQENQMYKIATEAMGKRCCQETSEGAKSMLGKIVGSHYFETLCASVIISNAVIIAAHSEWARKNLSEHTNSTYEVMDLAFTCFYTIELLMRVAWYKCSFFVAYHWKWNWFDLLLVISAINDQLSYIFGYTAFKESSDVVFLRILRLLKMLRLLRMIRLMKMFRELRLILNSIMTSMKAMIWSVLLIFVVLFMFGILFLQAVTNYLKEDPNLSAKDRESLDEHWGGVFQSLLSMYMAGMNGEDWKFIADPLWEVGPGFYLLFLLYTAFYYCAITNTLTSLFVEATIANSDCDQRQVVQHELDRTDHYVRMLKQWFGTIDKENSGEITMQQIDEHLGRPEMVAFAARMEIEVVELRQFFNLLSCSGRRPVDLQTFVVGCIKLRGSAKSMDLMDLMYSSRQAQSDQAKAFRSLEQQLRCLREIISEEHRRLSSQSATGYISPKTANLSSYGVGSRQPSVNSSGPSDEQVWQSKRFASGVSHPSS